MRLAKIDIGKRRISIRRSVQYKPAGKTLSVLFVIKKSLTKKKIPVITMYIRKDTEKLHKAEKKLLEFAKIHKDNGTKYAAAAEPILLTSSAGSEKLEARF